MAGWASMRGQVVTQGIVLARTDYQEADRILTILTPDHGKIRAIAKGARRSRSRLAGGIELLSVNELALFAGRSELRTLVSSRLVEHWGEIVRDIDRTMLAYELMKRMNRITEDGADESYFHILRRTLGALNSAVISAQLTELWFCMQILQATGHSPNLHNSGDGSALHKAEQYNFDFDAMCFNVHPAGVFTASHIKMLRIAQNCSTPEVLHRIQGISDYVPDVMQLAHSMTKFSLRV